MNANLTAAIELLREEMQHMDPDRLTLQYGEPARKFDSIWRKVCWTKLQKDLEHFSSGATEYMAVVARTNVEPKGNPSAPFEFRKEGDALIANIGGKRITGWTATDVYCSALAEFGLARVAELELTLCRTPLVSANAPKQSDGYPSVRLVGGWHIVVHCSTREKVKILRKIGHRLQG